MQENNRLVINGCDGDKMRRLLELIDADAEYEFKWRKEPTASVAQDRLCYSYKGERVSIVYEPKPALLVVTAPPSVLPLIGDKLNGKAKTNPLDRCRDIYRVLEQNGSRVNDKPNAAANGEKAVLSGKSEVNGKQKGVADKNAARNQAAKNNAEKSAALQNSVFSDKQNRTDSSTSTDKKPARDKFAFNDENIDKPNAAANGEKAVLSGKSEVNGKQKGVADKNAARNQAAKNNAEKSTALQNSVFSDKQNRVDNSTNADKKSARDTTDKLNPKTSKADSTVNTDKKIARDKADKLNPKTGKTDSPVNADKKSNRDTADNSNPKASKLDSRVNADKKPARDTTDKLNPKTVKSDSPVNADKKSARDTTDKLNSKTGKADSPVNADKKPARDTIDKLNPKTGKTDSHVNADKSTARSKSDKPQPKSKTASKAVKAADTAKDGAAADNAAGETEPEYKNGFVVKNVSEQRMGEILKKIKANKSLNYRQSKTEEADVRIYLVKDKTDKVYLRYNRNKKTVQLQGKRSSAFAELQLIVTRDSDYLTAVNSHIELTGEEKRARDMQKRLKKLLPNAFAYLSEQSKIDLTIGLIDIYNDEVKLSDYSMLLVPPYRGLERLIFDLQQAQGIEVKMIGQAYEKQDGKYVLKIGYRRRIPSVIYAEVMTALYTEYFEKRNFYAHSDITGDMLSRVITEKTAVRQIFDNLLALIDYNCKKLNEIGFRIR